MRFRHVLLLSVSIGWMLSCAGANGPDERGDPSALFVEIGDTVADPGEVIVVPVTLSLNPDAQFPVDSLSSFDLLISYPYNALRLLDVTRGEGNSQWEYFTYRRDGKPSNLLRRDVIRVLCFRNVIGEGGTTNQQLVPAGTIAQLVFEANSLPELARQSVEIGFQSLECQDNTFVDAEDPALLHFMREYDSLDSLDRPNDTLSCARRYRVVSDVHFRAGSVRLGDLTGESPPLPGDVDLDGITASVTDLTKFWRQFWGDAVFSEDSLVYARQLAASDVNRDGVPLHIADFEMLLRIVFANEDPYEPRNPPKEASVSRLDWGLQVESESPLSMVYVDAWVHSSDTVTYEFRAYPTPSRAVVTRVGERLRAVFDYIDSPYAGEFSPLVINVTPRPGSRLQLVDLQLSTPPGLSVPVGGRDPSL